MTRQWRRLTNWVWGETGPSVWDWERTWRTAGSICSGPVWRWSLFFQPTGCCHRRSTWLCWGGWRWGRVSARRQTGGWFSWLPPAPPLSSPDAELPHTSHTCSPTRLRMKLRVKLFTHAFVSGSGELPAEWQSYRVQLLPRPSAVCSQSECTRTEQPCGEKMWTIQILVQPISDVPLFANKSV